MNKLLHIQLLEYLGEVGKLTDISDFMVDKFKVKTETYNSNPLVYSSHPALLLHELEEDMKAIATNSEYDTALIFYDDDDGYTKPIWKNEDTSDRIYFYMTPKGSKCLEKYKRTHTSFISHLWKFLTKFWTIVGGIAALISIILLYLDKSKTSEANSKKSQLSKKTTKEAHQKPKTTTIVPKTLSSDSLDK